ncbi:hypothetical protein BC826DRAFT_137414 [Russula brevipes]|nr:hypothetical protein BC826DRAFT_137414 [Russula brevipes]
MSSTTGVSDTPESALEDLSRCLMEWRLTSNAVVASAALIFYDWFLTSGDELNFLWRRDGRHNGTYARILFFSARYPALACAIVDLGQPTVTQRHVTTYLRLITFSSSELILATRTWAIWQRSRSMLVFLFVLTIVCAVPALVIIRRDMATAVVVSSANLSLSGLRPCVMLTSAVKLGWIAVYAGVIAFETAVLALTSYKVLQTHRGVPRDLRSKLLDVLWIDGIMYFALMLLLCILNVGLVLQTSNAPLRGAGSQMQTVFHSILSTRIVLNITTAAKKDLNDPRPDFAQPRHSTRIEFGHVSGMMSTVSEEGGAGTVELRER